MGKVSWDWDLRDRAAKASGFDLENKDWIIILRHNRENNVYGPNPQLPPRMFGDKSNAAVAKMLNDQYGGVNPDTGKPFTERQASKIRNKRKPMPRKE